jgi:WD40 repeat protein
MKRTAAIAFLLAWPALCLPADPAPMSSPKAVAFSPDGKTLAAGCAAGKVGELVLWDVTTRKVRWKVSQPEPVRALAWAPDGKALVATVGPTIVLIDPGLGNSRGVVGRHGKGISCLALTTDGLTLATGGDDGSIKLWDVASRKGRRTIGANRGSVYSVCFAPDGKRLVSTGATEARLWEPGTGKALRTWTHDGFLVRSAVFTPDGKGIVTGGWDGSARLWDAQTGEQRGHFSGLGGLDGVLIHAGTHTLALWGHSRIALFDLDLRPPDAAMRRRIAGLLERLDDDDYRTRESASEALQRLGWVAAAVLRKEAKESKSAEVRIRSRTVLAALQKEPRMSFRGHTGNIRAVGFSTDGQTLASGSDDGTVRLWDRGGRPATILGR